MATPTSDEIEERARQDYMSDPNNLTEGEAPTEPEETELSEGGYTEHARNELMSESANLSPEDKLMAEQRKQELLEELRRLREALGYKPRPKKRRSKSLCR